MGPGFGGTCGKDEKGIQLKGFIFWRGELNGITIMVKERGPKIFKGIFRGPRTPSLEISLPLSNPPSPISKEGLKFFRGRGRRPPENPQKIWGPLPELQYLIINHNSSHLNSKGELEVKIDRMN